MLKGNKNKKWFVVTAVVIVCLAFSGLVRAGTVWVEKDKLLASDGAAWDRFGRSVSISGDLVIIGADGDDDNGDASGSAYIFTPNDIDPNNWDQQAKILASDGAAEDYFGFSVSISDDLAIVGARRDDDNGSDSGSAYIFTPNDIDPNNWDQQAKILASDGAAGDLFGDSVSISGNFAIVGADWDDDNGDASGSAYIFTPNDIDPNNWDQHAKLLASDGAADDKFGNSVSISGDLAIVGVWGDDDNGSDSGSAYIFRRDGSSWVQQQKLLASDGAALDLFGQSVSISGNFAIVGARWDDDNGSDSGSAYIFTPNDIDPNNWDQQAKLLASDGDAGDQFGWSVSISGDLAIVGAIYDDDKGADSGSAYIFKRDGSSWYQQAKLTASDGAADDYFGRSVSINSDFAIVGADCDDDNGDASGSAYVFQAAECADWLTADLNGDCFVDFYDFSIFASQWLKCGDPCDPNCVP